MSDSKFIRGRRFPLLILVAFLVGCSPEDERWQPYLFRHEGRWVAFHGIAIDRSGTKWFATSVGIRRFNGSTWTVYDTSNSPLLHNNINTVFVDSRGDVWAACWYHGVVRFGTGAHDQHGWSVLTKSDGLADIYVLAITEDKEGNVWFGTFDGVSKFDPTARENAWTTLRPENTGLTSTTVTALAVDDSGHIWFGTEPMWVRSGYVGGGLTSYNPYREGYSAWTTYDTTNSGLPSNAVRAMAFDSAGSVWIGTDRGLARFRPYTPDGQQWETFNSTTGALPSDVVNGIAVDQSGTVWVASADMGTAQAFKMGGVSMFDGNNWTTLTVVNSKLQDNRAIDLAVDRLGNLWICGFVGVDVYNASGVVREE
ncbi:MAG: two-component regulator propeller domain-containing protein [Bacteroidota bacterium]